MRILYLTQVLPYPLDAGPKVRAYHVLQHLAAQHQVTLVAFVRSSDSPESINHLRSICAAVHSAPMRRSRSADLLSAARSLFNAQPMTILRDERAEMYQLLDDLTARQPFDAIHADQLAMAQYALYAQRTLLRRNPGAKPLLTLDAHNAYYLIPQRLAKVARNPLMKAFLWREARLMTRYEGNVYQQFDHLLTVTDEDQQCIRAILPSGNALQMTTLPICVDAAPAPVERLPDAHGLLMLGGLHWPPNTDAARWFVNEIWPSVRRQAPEAQLFIVGQRPSDDVKAWGDFLGISQPEQANGAPIVVTGYVADPSPFIRASAALLAPLRSGGGMRVKIVDAMNWGLPVISTTIGCEGIKVTPGHDILIADTPADFAQSALDILCDRALRERLSTNGRRLVVQHYDYRTAYATLDGIYIETNHRSGQSSSRGCRCVQRLLGEVTLVKRTRGRVAGDS